MQDKEIPQNIEAEQAVLGAMLISDNAVEEMEERLQPDDFYRQSHRIVFAAMLALHARKQPVDMVTLIDELKKMEKLDDVGGVSYVTLLANTVPTAANAQWHAQIVKNAAVHRRLIETGTKLAALGYESQSDCQYVLDVAEQQLLQLASHRDSHRCVPVRHLASETMERFGSLLEHKTTLTGLSTGFPGLDKLTCGLQPAAFIILAARPSMGKTALALNIAQNVALRGAKEGETPKRVAFFSLEMSHEQLMQRMVCTEADLETQEILEDATPEEKEEMQERLWDALEKVTNASIFIDDTADLTLAELRSQARKLKAEEGLDLIVVDYLQLMHAPTGRYHNQNASLNANRQYEVAVISHGLKALARELSVPVLALSQLSRNVEGRQEKRPMLSDLRESGSLEQDADLVMFLYREDYYRDAEEEPTGLTELIVAKHRNGPTGKVELYFENHSTRFVNLD